MTANVNDLPLVRARREASAKKRQQVLDAVQHLQANGIRITCAAVARHARVSEGLVHSTALKPAVTEAINAQAQAVLDIAASRVPTRSRVTTDSLRQDLELARDEVRSLRQENRALRERVQRALGAEMNAATQHDALARIDALEGRNRDLLAQVDDLLTKSQQMETESATLREDLETNRRLMRRINT